VARALYIFCAMKPKWFAVLLAFLTALPGASAAREFSVLVYNVENLFDLDGVALYEQFKPESGPDYVYGPRQLLTKLEAIRQVLASFNDGAGPEIILFQELELDRTPFSDVRDFPGFLETFADTTVEAMLMQDFDPYISRLPIEALLLKYLEDHGITGYQIAQPDPFRSESWPAHKNVIFSRFPIIATNQRPSEDARDLMVAVVSVDGHPLVLMNNHWKSGASSANVEPVRVQNAHVVKAELEALLLRDPLADVILGGDFNSHYNQSATVAAHSGINSVLGSQGSELRLIEDPATHLYNLWHELPLEERGSEVWRARWGTLMQILVSRGLYDRSGIQYVDNSFQRVIVPGAVDARFGTPNDWAGFGPGSGFSDHLPVAARFRVVDDGLRGEWMALVNPSDERILPSDQPRVDYRIAEAERATIPDANVLASYDAARMSAAFGELFVVEAKLDSVNPFRVSVAGRSFQVFPDASEVFDEMRALQPGTTVRFIGELDDWRGNLQFVIRHSSWWLE